MKVIRNYNELLEYVSKLGVLPNTNIARKQEVLVNISDSILSSGGKYPFRVHFHRKRRIFEVKPGVKGRVPSRFVTV